MIDTPANPLEGLTAAEVRSRALSNTIPGWTAARRNVERNASLAEEAKGDLKAAKERLERQTLTLEHVGNCRVDPCLRCQEIALNDQRVTSSTIVMTAADGDDGLEGVEDSEPAPEHGYRLNSRCPVEGCEGRLTTELVGDDGLPNGMVACTACGILQDLDGAGMPIQWVQTDPDNPTLGCWEDELPADELSGSDAADAAFSAAMSGDDESLREIVNGVVAYPTLEQQQEALAAKGMA